jgi:uncharacterized membrane protein YphA (DoxX/SURF4 family)
MLCGRGTAGLPYTEFLGGALTILGLGMRFVSIPMIINMIVAIITVKLKNVGGLDDFAELDERCTR